jgi:glyoxylase-like metal-dependent hydrolase (beta-lactamase superfamily II)
MAVPGHTKESAVFIDDANKMIFTGDDIHISLWMHLHGCTGMKTWQTGTKRIIESFEK